MDPKEFSKPSGKLVENEEKHISFVPNPLPPEIVYDAELQELVANSHLLLGKLAGIGKLLPNPHLLIQPYLRREAVLSSRIEGTEASLSDLFIFEAVGEEPTHETFKRVREVRNYVHALEISLNAVRQGKPISLELIKNAHKRLLYRVRGQERHPGTFRTVQNWIGPLRQPIKYARYVPPPAGYLDIVLKNLEDFWRGAPHQIPTLVQCAVAHYQFEAIHPFVDGNGRIGRLLIVLQLCEKKILPQPLLYVSAYFERNKQEYVDRMLAVSQKSDWEGWVKFFLRAVCAQAEDTITTVEKLLKLSESYERRLRRNKATKNASRLKEHLFSNPYITAGNASQYLGVSFVTAQRAIDCLIQNGVLRAADSRKRNRVFLAREILSILN